MDEVKKPLMPKLIAAIWARYQRGSERHGIKPRNDLGACINVSLNGVFDYGKYLPELPKCAHLQDDRPDLQTISEEALLRMPRGEAMRLIECEVRRTIEAYIKIGGNPTSSAWRHHIQPADPH
jgi:hypothetical protein